MSWSPEGEFRFLDADFNNSEMENDIDDDTDSALVKDGIRHKITDMAKKFTTKWNVHNHNRCIFVQVDNYHFKDWQDYFSEGKGVNLLELVTNTTWFDFFYHLQKTPHFDTLQQELSRVVKYHPRHRIVPPAELVFNAFNLTSLNRIKIVIVGQDPYPTVKRIGGVDVAHATGLSFSVPSGLPCAESLKNIFASMIRHGHLRHCPNSGCLSFWALQGCFMINAALTTIAGKRNAHHKMWSDFTKDLIYYINHHCQNLVFIVWGSEANSVCQDIDPVRHLVITSSHPSPMSHNSPLRGNGYGGFKKEKVSYPSFNSVDHFGLANNYLLANGKSRIFWDVVV